MRSLRHSPVKATFLVIAMGCALAGCSSSGNNDWLALYNVAIDTWTNRNASASFEQAAAIPYATIGVRVDDGPEQILILATATNGEQLWAASSHVAITTRYGLVVRTSGFGTDLTGYSGSRRNGNPAAGAFDYSWRGDFADLGIFSLEIVCKATSVKFDPITILGKELDTSRANQHCEARQLHWSFDNIYWFSPKSGIIWKSVQQVHPKGPKLTLEILRPVEAL